MRGNAENESAGEFSVAYETLVGVRDLLKQALEHEASNSENVYRAKAHIDTVLELVAVSRFQRFLVDWAALVYVMLIGVAEGIFVELYCLWHGACFICLPNPLHLYDPANIQKLASIDFVSRIDGIPTVMSFTAEVLMWSSLGVWAQRVYGMAQRYKLREINFPLNIATYIGILARNTSVAAIVLIILKLSKFSVFGVKLDDFDATVGLSFMLGFFGDDAVRMLTQLRNSVLKRLPKQAKKENSEDSG